MSRWHNQYPDGHAFFCTDSVAGFAHSLNPKAVAVIYDEWEKARLALAVRILAYCIMPNHVHITLWAENGENVRKFLHRTLAQTSRRLKPGGGFWKERPRVLAVFSTSVLLEDGAILEVGCAAPAGPASAACNRSNEIYAANADWRVTSKKIGPRQFRVLRLHSTEAKSMYQTSSNSIKGGIMMDKSERMGLRFVMAALLAAALVFLLAFVGTASNDDSKDKKGKTHSHQTANKTRGSSSSSGKRNPSLGTQPRVNNGTHPASGTNSSHNAGYQRQGRSSSGANGRPNSGPNKPGNRSLYPGLKPRAASETPGTRGPQNRSLYPGLKPRAASETPGTRGPQNRSLYPGLKPRNAGETPGTRGPQNGGALPGHGNLPGANGSRLTKEAAHSGPTVHMVGGRPTTIRTEYTPRASQRSVKILRPAGFREPVMVRSGSHQGLWEYHNGNHVYNYHYAYWSYKHYDNYSRRSVYFHYGFFPYIVITRLFFDFYPRVVYVDSCPYNHCQYFHESRYDSLDTTMANIRKAWLVGNIDLIQRHVQKGDAKICVLLDGNYDYSVGPDDYLAMTSDALGQIRTQSFVWTKVKRRSDNTFTVFATQKYEDQDNKPATVYLSYTLARIDGNYYVTEVGSSQNPLI